MYNNFEIDILRKRSYSLIGGLTLPRDRGQGWNDCTCFRFLLGGGVENTRNRRPPLIWRWLSSRRAAMLVTHDPYGYGLPANDTESLRNLRRGFVVHENLKPRLVKAAVLTVRTDAACTRKLGDRSEESRRRASRQDGVSADSHARTRIISNRRRRLVEPV